MRATRWAHKNKLSVSDVLLAPGSVGRRRRASMACRAALALLVTGAGRGSIFLVAWLCRRLQQQTMSSAVAAFAAMRGEPKSVRREMFRRAGSMAI